MSVEDALSAAERLLPGVPAPKGATDERWQAIIPVGYFVEDEPEAIWPFVLKWGSHEQDDLRAAIATCLLEHLLVQRPETAVKSRSRSTTSRWICFSSNRQSQFPLARPGIFIRASEPSPSASCRGIIAISATDVSTA